MTEPQTKAAPRARRKPAPDRRWVRYSAEDRLEMILKEAVNFFAEHGFEAQTRDLAKRIGVSQGLIYRYFHTKEELIDKVFHRIYMSRWNIYWEELLSDRQIPLERRLKEFYKSYLSTFDDYAWMRISVYSGDHYLVRRYLRVVFERIIQVIYLELRHECGLPPIDPSEISKLDVELTWNMHATVIYLLIRRYVFQLGPSSDNNAVAEQAVDQFLVGTLLVLQKRHDNSTPSLSPRQIGKSVA